MGKSSVTTLPRTRTWGHDRKRTKKQASKLTSPTSEGNGAVALLWRTLLRMGRCLYAFCCVIAVCGRASSMITCTSRYFLLHFYTFPGARAIVGTALHDGGLSCFPDTPASTHSKRAYWIRLSLSAPKHPRCSQNWIGGATCGVGAEGVKGTVVETRLHPEASDYDGIFRVGVRGEDVI